MWSHPCRSQRRENCICGAVIVARGRGRGLTFHCWQGLAGSLRHRCESHCTFSENPSGVGLNAPQWSLAHCIYLRHLTLPCPPARVVEGVLLNAGLPNRLPKSDKQNPLPSWNTKLESGYQACAAAFLLHRQRVIRLEAVAEQLLAAPFTEGTPFTLPSATWQQIKDLLSEAEDLRPELGAGFGLTADGKWSGRSELNDDYCEYWEESDGAGRDGDSKGDSKGGSGTESKAMDTAGDGLPTDPDAEPSPGFNDDGDREMDAGAGLGLPKGWV